MKKAGWTIKPGHTVWCKTLEGGRIEGKVMWISDDVEIVWIRFKDVRYNDAEGLRELYASTFLLCLEATAV